MCLILFRFRPQTAEPLLVAANRDEFHQRASAGAQFWADQPNILAGQDLVAGGTWLGCSRQGRFAALTNFTQAGAATWPKSRGELVLGFFGRQPVGERLCAEHQGGSVRGIQLIAV